MTQIPKDVQKKIEKQSRTEHIYEKKYGGKDHSGYDTMMKYEINYEREDAFVNGAYYGYSLSLQSLTEQSQQIESLREIIKDREGKIEGLKNGIIKIKEWSKNFPPSLTDDIHKLSKQLLSQHK